MKLSIKQMNEKIVVEIINWRYEKPYDFYNNELDEESLQEFLENPYFAIVDQDDGLVGFFCIGESAQVPAGNQ